LGNEPGAFSKVKAHRACLPRFRHHQNAGAGAGLFRSSVPLRPAWTLRFGVHVGSDNRDRTPPLVRLKALCGPDDDASPCITVLLPDED
jgi:hypothetical protein